MEFKITTNEHLIVTKNNVSKNIDEMYSKNEIDAKIGDIETLLAAI
jgi:hypothetical protein